jgi:hypothetical protein
MERVDKRQNCQNNVVVFFMSHAQVLNAYKKYMEFLLQVVFASLTLYCTTIFFWAAGKVCYICVQCDKLRILVDVSVSDWLLLMEEVWRAVAVQDTASLRSLVQCFFFFLFTCPSSILIITGTETAGFLYM